MKLWIDVDCGVDDAHAIMLALNAEDVQIVGIGCVNGNTSLDNVCRNTLRVLELCGSLDVPVYRGSPRSLMGRDDKGTDFHGTDGLGDSETSPVDVSLIRDEHAAVALVRIVSENPGEITLFTAAPLTNIALALQLKPELGSLLKAATIMGGNIEGEGNVKLAGEFNFVCDAEAAFIVLNGLKCPINLLAFEPALRNGIPMEWVKRWRAIDTKRGRFNERITEKLIEKMPEDTLNGDTFVLYDAFAMVTLLHPESILESDLQYCTCELLGAFTRGMMVVDLRRHLGREPNVNIVKRIDTSYILRALEKNVKVET